jgi:hypothetical protein
MWVETGDLALNHTSAASHTRTLTQSSTQPLQCSILDTVQVTRASVLSTAEAVSDC